MKPVKPVVPTSMTTLGKTQVPVKSMNQQPKTKPQAPRETVHSAYSDRKSKEYHATVVDKMNPTKTKPNGLTVSEMPGLAN